MEHLVITINAILPIFIVIGVGFFLRTINFIGDNEKTLLSRITFAVALPMLILKNVLSIEVGEIFDGWLTLTVFIMYIGVYVLSLLLGRFVFQSNKRRMACFVSVTYRSNISYLALPLAANVYGEGIIPKIAIIIAFLAPMTNILTIAVMSTVDRERGFNPISILKEIVTNPPIIAIIIGVAISVLGISLPQVVLKSVDYLGNLAIPTALLGIGASIMFTTFRKHIWLLVFTNVYKLLFLPAVVGVILYLVGFQGERFFIAFLFILPPSATINYIMAEVYKCEPDYAANTIASTTLFSFFTITLALFTARSLGLY